MYMYFGGLISLRHSSGLAYKSLLNSFNIWIKLGYCNQSFVLFQGEEVGHRWRYVSEDL